MDTSTPQHFTIMYPTAGQHTLTTHSHQIHASMSESSWPLNHHSSSNTSSSSAQASSMFSIVNRAADFDYPSPAASAASPSYIHHHQQENFTGLHQSPSLSSDSSNDVMASPFTQVESSIGPNRVLTRRQRAALEQGSPGRRVSAPSIFSRTEQDHNPRHHSAMYLSPPTAGSRPQTPINASESNRYQPQRDRLSLNIASAIPMQMQSPRYPGPPTPASSSSPYSTYGPYYPGNSRSNSTSNASHPRSASPALSNASTLTSVSSSTSAPNTQTFPPFPCPPADSTSPLAAPRPKQRKQRLFNVDRKAICLYHKQYPNARQEDIGMRYGVERSTISKILKHKTKWLNVPEHEGMRIAKHRPSKFPEIEEELVKWLVECTQNKTVLSDALIRAKAKETARDLHIPDEKFKASSGWVENFKHRHGIRAGVWSGDGKNTRAARALGAGGLRDVDESGLSPLNPAFEVHSEVLDDTTSVTPSNYRGDMDLTVAPEDLQEPETAPQGNNERLEVESMALQPAWPESTVNMSSSHSINQSDPSNATARHDPMSHPPLARHHHHQTDSNMLLEHNLTSHQHVPEPDSQSHMHHESHYEAPPVYDDGTLVIYPPVPRIPDNSPPSLADAEEAINKLITFLDTTGRGIIDDQDRQRLTTIKCALFQAASGVPYNPGQ